MNYTEKGVKEGHFVLEEEKMCYYSCYSVFNHSPTQIVDLKETYSAHFQVHHIVFGYY